MARKGFDTGTTIIALGLVAIIVVAAVVGWRAIQPKNQIVFVGDSITDQARPDIESRFAVDENHLKAVGGKTIQDMSAAAHDLAELAPRKAVINLGTNNALLGQPVDKNSQDLSEVLGYYRDTTCVLVVTINEHMISPGGLDANGRAVSLNQQIRQWAAGSPGRKVIDWAQIVNDYDAAGTPDGALTLDTVHPTPLGQKRLLDAYEAGIASCPGD